MKFKRPPVVSLHVLGQQTVDMLVTIIWKIEHDIPLLEREQDVVDRILNAELKD